MSVSVNLQTASPASETTYPVVGSSELARLWRPIIDRKSLGYVDYIVTAGLDIDAENYEDVLAELRVLCTEIESLVEPQEDFVNPVFRCRRLIALITAHPPQSGDRLYIG